VTNPSEEPASAAWRAAATDLRIRVEAPCVRTDPRRGTETYIAFVPDFGSPLGMIVRSLAVSITDNPPIEFAGAVFHLALDTYGRYDRHEWIELLERARWFGAAPPPSWYTAVSPWHHDAVVMGAVGDELARIFGRPTSVTDSAPYRELDLLPGTEVLTFLARVPTGGVTPQSLRRWASDVAADWQRRHPRRPSNERES
jgi:hypothetical protein